MKDLAALRRRYEQDPPAVQVGGLASNLSRIAWFMKRQDASQALEPIFRESKYFAEWAAGHTSLEVQEVLAEVQLHLALWQRRVANGDPLDSIMEEPQKWSEKLLTIVGLI